MNRPTVISLFSGGGGFDIGAMQAGFEIAGAVERQPEYAEVYAANLGHRPIVDAIENVQPSQFDAAPDWLHASPPCQGDSRARTSAKFAHPDLAAGLEVCRFIKAWRPKYFTLENVIGYAHNKALHAIEDCLSAEGYWARRLVLDASEYGVPQSRVRLWIIASRLDVSVPVLPTPSRVKMGWYAAIQDLIPTLKESRLSPWQVAKLQERMPATHELLANSNTGSAVRRRPEQPAMTMGKSKDSCMQKVYLVNGQDSKTPIREALRPSATVTASAYKSMPKVLDAPVVLATNPRCAARFQTFPDSYELPEKVRIAGAIVGNAVPCQLSKLIGQSLIP